MRKFIILCLIIGIMTTVTGCLPQLFAPKPYKETQFLMDTVIDVTAYGPNAENAVKKAFAEFKRLHDITNNFDPNSQISRINQQAGVSKVTVDPDLIYMLQRSNYISDMAGGVFDISIGPLSDLWGIGRKGDYVPSREDIDNALKLVNYKVVEIDAVNNTVYLPQKGMLLDLGGVAKGYATDKAIEVLKSQGITSALVNAGGDVRVVGKRPDGQSWRIGVQDPRDQNGIAAKLALTEWDTMETSGDYQRYIVKDGVRYSHIIDPRTGVQPRQITSVTIVNNSSGDGDILSTAVFILGVEKGQELLKKFPGNEAIIITNDGQKILTPGLAGRVEQ